MPGPGAPPFCNIGLAGRRFVGAKLALVGVVTILPGMNTATSSAATASPLPAPRDPKLRRMANAIRALAMDAVEQAKSGHPGMPMGMADAADRKSTRLNSSHMSISYAVFCLKKQ